MFLSVVVLGEIVVENGSEMLMGRPTRSTMTLPLFLFASLIFISFQPYNFQQIYPCGVRLILTNL